MNLNKKSESPQFKVSKEKHGGGGGILRDGTLFAETGTHLDAMRITMAMTEFYREKQTIGKNNVYADPLKELEAWSHQMDTSDTLLMIALRDKITEIRNKYMPTKINLYSKRPKVFTIKAAESPLL